MEQSTGHTHSEIEELYIVAKGTITMRCDDHVEKVAAPAAVRVSPGTARSHRNEGDEPVEIWAVSVPGHHDATKIDDFWEPSPDAKQTR
jgi:mannose-6-phosphate isomerase-like protein (cupin superfamily)